MASSVESSECYCSSDEEMANESYDELLSLINSSLTLGGEDELPHLSQLELEINALECHFNWIRSSQFTTSNDCSQASDRNERWMEETKNDTTLPYYKILTQNLIKALVAYLKKEFDLSLQLLDEAVAGVDKKEQEVGFSSGHYVAYKFLLYANQLVVKLALGEMSRAEELRGKMVEMDVSSPSSQALLLIIKSCYFGWFDDYTKRQALIEQALSLDPDVPDYILEHYRVLRSRRRDEDFLSAPTPTEQKLILRLYKMAPTSPTVLRNIGTFYHDAIKAHTYGRSSICEIVEELGIEEVVRRMIDCARFAAELNPESVGAGIRYAEVLVYGPNGFKNSNRAESEAQFLKCLAKWPTSSEAMHKIGKHYCLLGGKSFVIGLNYLKQALEVDKANFPCLMDLVRYRLRADMERCIPELLEILKFHVSEVRHHPILLDKLRIMIGSLLVRQNKFEEGVDYWIQGLKEPQNIFEIPEHHVEVMLAKGFDRFPRPGLCSALVKFLEKEISKAERVGEQTLVNTLSAVCEVFKKEVKKLTRPTVSDLDSDWRSSTDSLAYMPHASQRSNNVGGCAMYDAHFGGHPAGYDGERNMSTSSTGSYSSGTSGRSRYMSSSSECSSSFELPPRRNYTRGNENNTSNRNVNGRDAWRKPSVSDNDDNWRRRK